MGVLVGVGCVIVYCFVCVGVCVVLIVCVSEVFDYVVEEVCELGGEVIVLLLDVVDVEVMEVVVECIELEFGLIDIWINVVMVIIFVLVSEIQFEEFCCVIDVIYFGIVYGIMVVFKCMC